jgi:subtilisin family serine protease
LIGVLDTRLPLLNGQLTHDDLKDPSRFLMGIDERYYDDPTNNRDEYLSDAQGHGSHVLGIVGATSNNGIGIAGVNWYSKIRVCKFLCVNENLEL